jgi:hypothetical protein
MRAIKQILLTFAAFALVFAVPQARAASIAPQEARDIAAEAYIYFYPLVSMDVTRRQLINTLSGVNVFGHLRTFPDAQFREVVRPNFDTLYSSAWLDLTNGPVIVSAPDTHGRYYLLPMLDMWTDVFAVPGKRTSGIEAGNFGVVPPGWTGALPDGVTRIQSPTVYVWVLGRTQTNGPADYPFVNKIQDGYKITPLSQWGKPPQPANFVADASVDMKTPPKVQVDRMKPADFFRYAAELLKVSPPHVTDWSQIARLARIGIVPGESFDLASLDPAVRTAIEQGAADAARIMKEKAPTLARVVNGWQMNTDTMGVYGDYYLKRAIIAQILLGANQPEDAIYPFNVADADGKPVVGGEKYVMHFAKDQLPPVYAFWSLTMYDAEGFQVANPLNRFSLGDRSALKYNADGSLDLYIEPGDPGPDKEPNWLPAPASGALGLTMRLYAPKLPVLEGAWAPPPVRKVP